MRWLAIGLATFAMSAVPAYGRNLVEADLNFTPPKSVALVDMDTLKRGAGEATIWSYLYDAGGESSKYVSVILWSFDCKLSQIHYLSNNTYDINGTYLHSFPPQSGISYIVPGTVGDKIKALVCDGKMPSQISVAGDQDPYTVIRTLIDYK